VQDLPRLQGHVGLDGARHQGVPTPGTEAGCVTVDVVAVGAFHGRLSLIAYRVSLIAYRLFFVCWGIVLCPNDALVSPRGFITRCRILIRRVVGTTFFG